MKFVSMKWYRIATFLDQDLRDALDHVEQGEDIPQQFYPEQFEVSEIEAFPVKQLHDWMDYSSWGEWNNGELRDLLQKDGKNALFEELKRFRGEDWAFRAMGWLDNGIATIPTVILVETPSGYRDVGDGRGRISLAIGMGLETIPVAIAKPRD